MKIMKIAMWAVTICMLAAVAYFSFTVRMPTFSSETILDYDPWWFYRHAEEILNNNLVVPTWDMLSFYPPGRPAQVPQGWPYMMVFIYKILNFFTNITFMDSAKFAPVIVTTLTIIPAFLLGRLLSNNWGGIATALFAVLAPTLIGVSMAGYCDTDAPVVFFSFLCIYIIALAIKKGDAKKPVRVLLIALAVLLNVTFIYTWFFGWYILFFFILLIPALFVFRIIEEIIHERKLVFNLSKLIAEDKQIAIPILIIFVATNIITFLLAVNSYFNPIEATIYGFIAANLGFVSHSGLIVNVSVAELQVINILTKDGFNAVAGRIGLAPTILTLLGLPVLVAYKVIKKIRIDFIEIFLFFLAFLTFYMILNGVRFSQQFSIAASCAAGYVIGNIVKYMKKDIITATLVAYILLLSVSFVSDAIQLGNSAVGMEVDSNWMEMLDWLKTNADKNSLVATWWDPGHIIAGYTGLKVHADGAHCGPKECIPYNHDTRIQDMGRMMSVSSEEESISIMKKYLELTPAQQQAVKATFGDKVPQEAFTPVSDVYFIASSDLIGKYYWMSYFGTGQGRNFLQLNFQKYDQSQGIVYYGSGELMLVRNEDRWVPVMNIPEQGIRNIVVKEVHYYEDGERYYEFGNVTNAIDGLVWVDPSYGAVIFMPPEVRDSVFTRLYFFDGEGLNHFQMVYQNPEIRLYKVIF